MNSFSILFLDFHDILEKKWIALWDIQYFSLRYPKYRRATINQEIQEKNAVRLYQKKKKEKKINYISSDDEQVNQDPIVDNYDHDEAIIMIDEEAFELDKESSNKHESDKQE